MSRTYLFLFIIVILLDRIRVLDRVLSLVGGGEAKTRHRCFDLVLLSYLFPMISHLDRRCKSFLHTRDNMSLLRVSMAVSPDHQWP